MKPVHAVQEQSQRKEGDSSEVAKLVSALDRVCAVLHFSKEVFKVLVFVIDVEVDDRIPSEYNLRDKGELNEEEAQFREGIDSLKLLEELTDVVIEDNEDNRLNCNGSPDNSLKLVSHVIKYLLIYIINN